MRKILLFIVLLAPGLARLYAQVPANVTPAGTAALIGTFYDLKLTQNHAASNLSIDGYVKVVNNLLTHHWDETILNRYYRTTLPLATTQVFIPMMGSDRAPKAFGVEKLVQSRLWIAWYKGQVMPPSPGRWRFWGYGDDLCAVAVNGKTVLFSSRFDGPWKTKAPPGLQSGNGQLAAGDWIDFKPGETVDLDIILGDLPGGVFGCFIMIEKEGDVYAKNHGAPILPIFQLAPYDTPAPYVYDAPLFQRNGPVWKAIQ